jgi:Transposase
MRDKVDARKLAELLRAGMLRPVYHGENGLRTLHELARSYQTISKDLTRVMNRLKALYRGWGIPCAGTQVYATRYRMESGPLAYRCFLPECLRDVLLPLQHPERLQPLPGSLGTTGVNGNNHAIRYAPPSGSVSFDPDCPLRHVNGAGGPDLDRVHPRVLRVVGCQRHVRPKLKDR